MEYARIVEETPHPAMLITESLDARHLQCLFLLIGTYLSSAKREHELTFRVSANGSRVDSGTGREDLW